MHTQNPNGKQGSEIGRQKTFSISLWNVFYTNTQLVDFMQIWLLVQTEVDTRRKLEV